MSRTMQQPRQQEPQKEPQTGSGGTPIWVWAVYVLGILAATILAVSVLFTAGAYFLSDDVPVSANVSWLALVVWGGLCVLAGGLWIYRRRR